MSLNNLLCFNQLTLFLFWRSMHKKFWWKTKLHCQYDEVYIAVFTHVLHWENSIGGGLLSWGWNELLLRLRGWNWFVYIFLSWNFPKTQSLEDETRERKIFLLRKVSYQTSKTPEAMAWRYTRDESIKLRFSRANRHFINAKRMCFVILRFYNYPRWFY